jgi:sporulation protein YabP
MVKELPHALSVENRKFLSVTGVTEVESFDENVISAVTDLGSLKISGENLNIKKLSLEQGDLEIEGKINSLVYSEKFLAGKGFFAKIFR